MENDQSTTPTFPQNPSNGVSFPTVGQPQKSNGSKMLLIIGILILVGILGFVIYKSATNKSESSLTEPTPYDNLTTSTNQITDVPTPTPVSTSTPKPSKKSALTIEIQNGTGITGEAAYLQNQLKILGYINIKVGNATTSSATATTVTFSNSLSTSVITEITQKLNSVYQTVTTKNAATSTTDVVIVTGLRKTVASPTPTPTPIP